MIIESGILFLLFLSIIVHADPTVTGATEFQGIVGDSLTETDRPACVREDSESLDPASNVWRYVRSQDESSHTCHIL